MRRRTRMDTVRLRPPLSVRSRSTGICEIRGTYNQATGALPMFHGLPNQPGEPISHFFWKKNLDPITSQA